MTRLVLIDCQSTPTKLATYEGRKQLYAFTFPGILGPEEAEAARLWLVPPKPEDPEAA